VYFLFKAADEIGEIIGGLGILRQAGLPGLLQHGRQLHAAQLLYLQLARQDVHGQLLHILLVALIHPVHHADVFHQYQLMLFQGLHYFVHIGLCLCKLGFHLSNGLTRLLKQAKKALLLLRVEVKALELHHQTAQHVSHLTQILGLDAAQSGVGELGDVLLGGTAVIHYLLGIGNVYLL